MNTKTTKKFIEEHGIVVLKADKSQPSEEIDELLIELGNDGLTLPFVAVLPADGGAPVSLDGLITQGDVLDALAKAGPSKSPPGKGPSLAGALTSDGNTKGAELPWQAFSRRKLDELRAAGHTVLVDFTADW